MLWTRNYWWNIEYFLIGINWIYCFEPKHMNITYRWPAYFSFRWLFRRWSLFFVGNFCAFRTVAAMALRMLLSRPTVSYSIGFCSLPLQLFSINPSRWTSHACTDFCYLMTTATWFFALLDFSPFLWLRNSVLVPNCLFFVPLFSPMILARRGGILKRAHNTYWNCTLLSILFFFAFSPFDGNTNSYHFTLRVFALKK